MLQNQLMSRLSSILESGALTDDGRDLLGQSLLYVCSGKDPTPIAAFGANVPLYVYIDSFVYMHGEFAEEARELYQRIARLAFRLVESRKLTSVGRLRKAAHAELTLWEDATGAEFLLLLAQTDAAEGYRSIYGDGMNYVQPMYLCNILHELACPDILSQVEKRVQYILGHCHSPKYRVVGAYDYLGDHASSGGYKAELYRRLYYYLF